jgi:hypothetical protein
LCDVFYSVTSESENKLNSRPQSCKRRNRTTVAQPAILPTSSYFTSWNTKDEPHSGAVSVSDIHNAVLFVRNATIITKHREGSPPFINLFLSALFSNM